MLRSSPCSSAPWPQLALAASAGATTSARRARTAAADAGEHEPEQQLVRLQPGHARTGQEAVQRRSPATGRSRRRRSTTPARPRTRPTGSASAAAASTRLHGRRHHADPDRHRAGRRRRRRTRRTPRGGSSSPPRRSRSPNMTVAPGDHMHASIAELVAGLERVDDRPAGRDARRVVLADRAVPVDASDRRVDRGDAASDRHGRRLRARCRTSTTRSSTTRRRTASPRTCQASRGDPADRLERQRDRHALGAGRRDGTASTPAPGRPLRP